MKAISKETSVYNNNILDFPIIQNGSEWISTEDRNLAVLESGPSRIFFNKILEAINAAREVICLQSFLIQDSPIIDALVKAVQQRHVRVFVLSSAEARLKESIITEEDFIKDAYINMLGTKFKNNFVHRVAENFHAKYILIDPASSKKGFMCTGNFTDNGFFKSPELAIELTRAQFDELYKVFVYHFWEHSTQEQTGEQEFKVVKPAGRFTAPQLNEILLMSPNKQINTLDLALTKAVEEAKESITISTYILDKNIDLVKTLISKAQQKIAVTVFCRSIEWLYNEHLKLLKQAGIQIIMHPFMHGKSLLTDGKSGFIFTANLIEKGLKEGFEVGVKLTTEQTQALAEIQQSWFRTFPFKLAKKTKISELTAIYELRKERAELKPINEDQKEISKDVQVVKELPAFFNQPLTPSGPFTRLTRYKLTARLKTPPATPSASAKGPFEIMEIINEKKVKEQVLVLNNSFITDDLIQLQNYQNLRVYMQ